MTIHVHELSGCAAQPLAHYLKGLALLRVLHEQADPAARAAWRDDRLVLCTELDRGSLLGFFLDRWSPTPLVDPWNGGSGFFPGDKAARTRGVEPIAASSHERLAAYRGAIADCRRRVEGLKERPSDAAKRRLLAQCRNEWAPALLGWFRAAVVMVGDDVAYPALLGTGGNDGRLDFCANFMQRLCDVIDPESGGPRPHASSLLEGALFATPTRGLVASAVGQFLPGGAGGANAGQGFDGAALVNPWDFIFMMEGAAGIPVAAVRALEADEPPQAAAPFAVRSMAAGFASAAYSEESARGEQWMPLWTNFCAWPEIVALFREGRMTVGKRRARRAVDAAQAVCRRGVAQGVSAFQRFAFIERNGQSNLAVPVGTFPVTDRPEIGLLDDVMPWVDSLRRSSGKASESFRTDLRRIDDAVIDLCRGFGTERWQELVIALARAEDRLVARPGFTREHRLRPLPRLRSAWLEQVVGHRGTSREVRLATALASARWPGRHDLHSSVRGHCVPLDSRRRHVFDWETSTRVVWRGRDLVSDLVSIVRRRLVEAAREGADGLPLVGRLTARTSDIAAFLLGHVDDARIATLARGLMAVHWSGDLERASRLLHETDEERMDVPSTWATVRLVYAPSGALGEDFRAVVDPRPLSLLVAGRLDRGVEAAARRLAANGFRPRARTGIGDAALASRFAAALAFPLSRPTYAHLLRVAARMPPSRSPAHVDSTTEETP